MKVTTNIPGVLARLEKLAALLPSVPAAAAGGGGAMKGAVMRVRNAAFSNYVGGVGEGHVMGAMQQALNDTLRAAVAIQRQDDPEQGQVMDELMVGIIASYRGSPTAEGTLHECQSPAAAENRPGVVQRAVQAMQGYRTPGLTYEREDILGREEFTDAGGERRTRRIIREGAKKTRPVEYYPRKDQSRRLKDGGEVEVFKEQIAADLDRARQWVRDWVYSNDPEFGKRKDAVVDADLEQTVTRIERLLGIERGQDQEYNAEMKAAAAALLPHIQGYVDAYDPLEKQKEGVPPEELMSVFPSDLSRKLQAEGKKLNAQWSAAILSAWRKVAENLYPEFLAQGLRAAMKDAGWGEAAKGAQGRLGV